jgi:hypothetical protein
VRIFEKYYQTLELSPQADEREVKSAYRRLAKRYHPDRSGNPATRQKFIEVNEAYEILMKRDELVQEAIRRYYRKQQSGVRSPNPQPDPRARARAHADMKYEEFIKSPIYRTAMVLDSAFDYIFLFLGFIMILAPILGYIAETMNRENLKREPEFHILPVFLGLGFIYGVWYFLFKSKRIKS